MEEAGEFVVILVHTLAHITVSGTRRVWDDKDADFVEAFYKGLRVACADMFFARSHKAVRALESLTHKSPRKPEVPFCLSLIVA